MSNEVQNQNLRKPFLFPRSIAFVVILLLSFFALGAWAFASPVGSSPDEDFHLTSIWCSGRGVPGICDSGESSTTRLVSRTLLESPCFAYHPEISGACQTEIDLFGDTSETITNRGNFAGGYPPIFYSVMHLLASTDIQLSVILMRFLNILVFLFFAAFTWLASRSSSTVTQKFIWPITLVPLGLFLIPSINPSGWAITGVGFATINLWEYLSTNSRSRRNWGLITLYMLASIVAAGSRSDAAIYVVIATISVCLIKYKTFAGRIKLFLAPAFNSLLMFFFYLSFGQGAAVAGSGFAENHFIERSPLTVLSVNIFKLPDLFLGIFGTWKLGWLDTSMPQTVWAGASAAFVSIAVLALQRMTKILMTVFLGLIGLGVFIPLYILQKTNAYVGEYLQPRYLLPLFVLIGIVVLLVFQEGKNPGNLITRLLLWAGLVLAQMIALYLHMDRYVHGFSFRKDPNLNHDIQWWWPSLGIGPMHFFIIGSISFAILTALLMFSFNQKNTINNSFTSNL